MPDINEARREAFLQGVAAALAEIHRLHGSDVEVQDVLRGFGLTAAELVAAKVDLDDMKVLRRIMEG